MKPYGFPIHGCIDGYSRKVLWLYVTHSNNLPDNIAAYYLDAVRDQGGCPVNSILILALKMALWLVFIHFLLMIQTRTDMYHLLATKELRDGGVSRRNNGLHGGLAF